MRNNFNRSLSREVAVKLLYNADINNENASVEEKLSDIFDMEEIDGNKVDTEYVKSLVKKEEENHEKVMALIEKNLDGWTISRISKINLAILRCAITEMLFFEDIPNKVSINEAVNITKKYSDESNKGFINTVLDKVLKEIQ